MAETLAAAVRSYLCESLRCATRLWLRGGVDCPHSRGRVCNPPAPVAVFSSVENKPFFSFKCLTFIVLETPRTSSPSLEGLVEGLTGQP